MKHSLNCLFVKQPGKRGGVEISNAGLGGAYVQNHKSQKALIIFSLKKLLS